MSTPIEQLPRTEWGTPEPVYRHLRDITPEDFRGIAGIIDAEEVGFTQDEGVLGTEWFTYKHKATGFLIDFRGMYVRLRTDSEDPDRPGYLSPENRKYRQRTNPNIAITGLGEFSPYAFIVVVNGDTVSFMGRYVESSRYNEQKGRPVERYVTEMTFTKEGYSISQRPFPTIEDPKVLETFGPWPSY